MKKVKKSLYVNLTHAQESYDFFEKIISNDETLTGLALVGEHHVAKYKDCIFTNSLERVKTVRGTEIPRVRINEIYADGPPQQVKELEKKLLENYPF